MLKTPPHILVTTPESLYLLLTAERSREMLRTARTVIVDEIHAVIGTRRGAHLALSLERLQQVADRRRCVRLGLSATQKPIEEVARFSSARDCRASASQVVASRVRRSRMHSLPPCTIVDEGHRRPMDLGLEIPALAARSGDVARGLGASTTIGSPRSSTRTGRRWCSSTRGGWPSD